MRAPHGCRGLMLAALSVFIVLGGSADAIAGPSLAEAVLEGPPEPGLKGLLTGGPPPTREH